MNSKLLVISPEQIVPPKYGGSLRSANIILGLAKEFETTVIVPQEQINIENGIKYDPEISQINWVSQPKYPKSQPTTIGKIINRFYTWQEKKQRKQWHGIFSNWYFGPLSSWNCNIQKTINRIKPDAVIIEHTRPSATLDFIKKIHPSAIRIVDSHNVESDLLNQILKDKYPPKFTQKTIEKIKKYEQLLNKRCDMLWACSTNDIERYKELGVTKPQISVVPNGVNTKAIPFRIGQPTAITPQIVFTGSLCWQPNETGIQWFYNEVWPILKKTVKNIHWDIVGRTPSQNIRDIANADEAITLHADVKSVIPYLHKAHVGICPLFTGSGTRLKIIESFSAGLPMVSTRLGAEGIETINNKDIIIADEAEQFATAILDIIDHPIKAEIIRKNAHKLAIDQYDWTSISKKATLQLIEILQHKNK